MKPITFKQFIDSFEFYTTIVSDNSSGYEVDSDIIRIYPSIPNEDNDTYWFELGILDSEIFTKNQMIDLIFSKNILDSTIYKIYRDADGNLCIVLSSNFASKKE